MSSELDPHSVVLYKWDDQGRLQTTNKFARNLEEAKRIASEFEHDLVKIYNEFMELISINSDGGPDGEIYA